MMTKQFILASQSPRRKDLLARAGFQFDTVSLKVDEQYPDTLPAEEVAYYLAQKKAAALQPELNDGMVALTADTTVVLDNRLLEKADNEEQAKAFLNRLSGRSHRVITGVSVFDKDQMQVIQSVTSVTFKDLHPDEIDYYVSHCKPFDKAGAYGIQDWIGLVGILRLEGSYHNVVGLPVSEILPLLASFGIYPQPGYN